MFQFWKSAKQPLLHDEENPAPRPLADYTTLLGTDNTLVLSFLAADDLISLFSVNQYWRTRVHHYQWHQAQREMLVQLALTDATQLARELRDQATTEERAHLQSLYENANTIDIAQRQALTPNDKTMVKQWLIHFHLEFFQKKRSFKRKCKKRKIKIRVCDFAVMPLLITIASILPFKLKPLYDQEKEQNLALFNQALTRRDQIYQEIDAYLGNHSLLSLPGSCADFSQAYENNKIYGVNIDSGARLTRDEYNPYCYSLGANDRISCWNAPHCREMIGESCPAEYYGVWDLDKKEYAHCVCWGYAPQATFLPMDKSLQDLTNECRDLNTNLGVVNLGEVTHPEYVKNHDMPIEFSAYGTFPFHFAPPILGVFFIIAWLIKKFTYDPGKIQKENNIHAFFNRIEKPLTKAHGRLEWEEKYLSVRHT